MAHFAKIENGIVTAVIVVDDSHELNGQEYLNSIDIEGTWVQTSYNATFGKKFAAIGDTYAPSTGNFKSPQPFASWTFSNTEWIWKAPKAEPNDSKAHRWVEELLEWVEI